MVGVWHPVDNGQFQIRFQPMKPLLATLALLVLACGGTPPAPTQPPTARPTEGTSTEGTPTAAPTAAATATPEPAASYVPGGVLFRVVNLYHDSTGAEAPLDVYVRTQGLVQAFAVQAGLAYGAATDYFAPPDPGTVVATTAGATDPTCVADCPHIISESSTTFGEGDRRTLVIYGEGTMELWHNPEPSSVGATGNALVPADPSTALLLTVGVALQEADFGLRLGFAGVAGCQLNRAGESVLVGGNQVGVFAFDGPTDVLFYDNRDADCSSDPVGGSFAVDGAAGTRTLVVLHGRPTEMEALVLDV